METLPVTATVVQVPADVYTVYPSARCNLCQTYHGSIPCNNQNLRHALLNPWR